MRGEFKRTKQKEPFRNSNSDHVDDSIMGKVIEKAMRRKNKTKF